MSKSILEVAAEKVAEKGGEYVAKVVSDKLAEVIVNKRIDTITKAIQKQEQLDKDLKKINKNDVTHYVEGNPFESMSKQRFDDIKKLKEKTEKLTKATEAALEQNSTDAYNKLEETLKKLDNAGSNKTEGSAEGE